MSQQQRFEDEARAAMRAIQRGTLDLRAAGQLANDLGDDFATARLAMLCDVLHDHTELIEMEIAAVDARLADEVHK